MTPKSGHSAAKSGHSGFSVSPKIKNVPILQRGSVLLPVVVAIVLLAAITYMLGNQAVNQANIVSGELERDRLRYVAEAGIAHAKLQLSRNTSCDNYADIPKTGFAGEDYTAQLSPKEGSPVRITASVDLGSGQKLNLYSDAVPAYESPNTVMLQLSATDGKDVMIDSFYGNANYGSVDDLTVRSDPSWIQRPLLEFDLSAIPAGVQIVSAILDLELRIVSVPGSIGVHRMTRSWVEGTGQGTGNADGATWNDHDGSASWTQPGGDFDSTLYATAAVSSANNGQRVSWNVRDLVDGWVSGQFPNYGLALVGDGTVNNAEFESREESDPAAAPRLTIVYACECGKVCAGATEAGKNVLLVVGDTANLTVEQQAKKTLMEGWGHTVSLIATSASQADFDTETANNDVVYVPELGSTPMSELGDKADNLAKGVITEESRKALLMGGFNLFPFVDADSISITDNSHYLTETLPIGNVQLSTVVQSFWVLKPTLATDLHVLGELNGSEPGLAYLDNGELRNDGSPAPSRRVKLPWGAYNFDINLLTDDGLEIMQRAIEWGAGVGPTQTVLLVVPDASSLTAQDAEKQSLIQSWGFGVTLISHSATQEDFDAATAASDVVYLSEEISSGELGTKLRDSTIGVVIEDKESMVVFGFGPAYVIRNDTDLEILDNSHYITATLAIGVLSITNSVQPLVSISGYPPADSATLGHAPGAPLHEQLTTIDTGRNLDGGGTAAGRRVKLPWGDNDFDINSLTADGQTIMRRSIEWGAGTEGAGLSGPIAHWKLDDGMGTTAIDSEGGHHGTLSLNGPTWVVGQLGDALQFDGSDDLVDLTSDAELDDIFVGGATVMAWIEPAGWGSNGYGRIFDKSTSPSSTGDGWAIRLNVDNGGLNFGQGFTGGRGWWRIPSNSVTIGEWQHVALAYDANSTTNDPVIYLGGSPVAVTRIDAPSGDVRSDAAIDLHLGAHASAITTLFDGKIDDARIYDRVLSAAEVADIVAGGGGGGGGDGGGGGSCDGIYLDQFEVYQFDNSDGTLDWSTSPWQEIGESDGPTAGDIRIWSDLDSVRIRTRDNDNGGEGIEREADLSGAATAMLSYDYRRDRLDNSNDYTTVEVSANGAAGPWTELARYAGPNNDSAYTTASHDISGQISANTRIRFKTSANMGGLDHVWFDNIQIACAP